MTDEASPAPAPENPPTGPAVPYAPPRRLRRYMRRMSALAVVAGALTGGIALSQPAKHAEAMPPPPCHATGYLLSWDEWVITNNC